MWSSVSKEIEILPENAHPPELRVIPPRMPTKSSHRRLVPAMASHLLPPERFRLTHQAIRMRFPPVTRSGGRRNNDGVVSNNAPPSDHLDPAKVVGGRPRRTSSSLIGLEGSAPHDSSELHFESRLHRQRWYMRQTETSLVLTSN